MLYFIRYRHTPKITRFLQNMNGKKLGLGEKDWVFELKNTERKN
jgi:hypothetical protein